MLGNQMKLVLFAFAAVAVVSGGSYVVSLIRSDAQNDLRQEIIEQNTEAREHADEIELDFGACTNLGRVWDFAAGECGDAF